MAKKTRTPPPPRRPVQAPQRRAEARDPESRRALLYLVVIATLGLAILGGLLAWLSLRDGGGGGGSSALGPAMRAAGCTYRKLPNEGRVHVPDGTPVKYKSKPVGASGNHYASPAVWNIYDTPVEQPRLVHNLEHGGIVIQYGRNVPDETVGEIRQFYLDDPNGLVVAPLPRLGNRIAMSAWTHVATCTEFDESAFSRFRDDFRYEGPERVPAEFLAPGR